MDTTRSYQGCFHEERLAIGANQPQSGRKLPENNGSFGERGYFFTVEKQFDI